MGDYETYPYSSFEALVSNGRTLIKRAEVLQLFGGIEDLKECLADKQKIIESVQESMLEDDD
jgi:hypothetical protein